MLPHVKAEQGGAGAVNNALHQRIVLIELRAFISSCDFSMLYFFSSWKEQVANGHERGSNNGIGKGFHITWLGVEQMMSFPSSSWPSQALQH